MEDYDQVDEEQESDEMPVVDGVEFPLPVFEKIDYTRSKLGEDEQLIK